jgi:hypothetical protein
MEQIFDYIVTNIVIITSLFAGIRWIWEYSQSRKFEKNKFLLERIEKFLELDSTKKVHKLLDWNKISIEFDSKTEIIDDGILIQSLVTHNKKNHFEPVEMNIRSIFDEYFDNLSKLIILSRTGLVDEKNLKKFLVYWMNILNGKSNNKPKLFTDIIHEYLIFYGYQDVLNFIK